MRKQHARWLAMLLLALVLASAAQGEKVQMYEGAAALFSLDKITVVYPQAEGRQLRINRGEADRVAAYLNSRHGVLSEIAADSAISAQQLGGHLLLLGWENRLLGTALAPRPFERDAKQLRFLGSIEDDPSADLLMIHISPFNQDKFLAFWSRIDPEMEKFWGFPFMGSDWVIYHDYYATQQGMLSGDMDWPPTRNPLAEKSYVPYTLPPLQTSSEHYHLHYWPDQLAEAEAREILGARESALQKAIALIGEPGEDLAISLYVYADIDEKLKLTGVDDPVHCLTRTRELHMAQRHAFTTNPHDDIHFVAREVYGPNFLSTLYRGLPIALAAEEQAGELQVYAAELHELGSFPTVADLLDDERLRKHAFAGTGFKASALLVEWIRSTGGDDAFASAYRLLRDDAVVELARLLDIPAERIESSFAGWVAQLAEAGRLELAFRRKLSQALEQGGRGDEQGAIATLEEALRLKPEDPGTLYRLGMRQRKIENYGGAIDTFRRLSQLQPAAADLRYLIFGHYQLGQIYGSQGNHDAAREEYRKILALPDQHKSHALATEALQLTLGEDRPEEP